MKAFVAESGVEEVCLEHFAELGWQVLHEPDIAPGEPRPSGPRTCDVLLEGRLRSAIARLNPQLSAAAINNVVGDRTPAGERRHDGRELASQRSGQPKTAKSDPTSPPCWTSSTPLATASSSLMR